MLILEADTTMTAGVYASAWFDTHGVDSIRVVSEGGNGATIEESNNQTDILSSRLAGDDVTLPLTARYFRATSAGGTSEPYHIAIRTLP